MPSAMPATLGELQTEKQFRRSVMDYAQICGWLVEYIPDSRRLVGNRGRPDLVLARGGQVLLAELKTTRGKPSANQLEWLREAGDTARVWNPSDWDEIETTLSKRHAR